MDVIKYRKDFPFLSSAKPLIYLDSAATSQKPASVIKAMSDFYTFQNANPHRGIYPLGEQATELYAQARQTVAHFLNAADEEIVFTSGTTASINFIADTWAAACIQKDDEIVVTQLEHHANFLPWQRLAEKKGARLRFIELDKESFALKYSGKELFTSRTKLLAVTHSSNIVGPVWDEKSRQLERLIDDAHAVGAKVFVDAAQSIPHKPLDLQKLKADILAFSGHKILGPTGIGVLFIRKELHDEVPPYQVGGSMVYSAGFEKSTWQAAPLKFEAGTPPIAQAIGLKSALEYLNAVDMDALLQHEAVLCNRLLDGLAKIKGISVLGNQDWIRLRGHLVSFVVEGVHAHDLAYYLGMNNIAVRAGNHCAQPLSELLGVSASMRVSFYLYTTKQEIDVFLQALKAGIKTLRKINVGSS